MMLGLLATSCGQGAAPGATGRDDPGSPQTAAGPLESTKTNPSAPPTVTASTGSTVDAPSRLPWCDDIAPLAGDVLGNLPGSENVDFVFEGVVHTYANEHRDTFAGMWIDRDAGGTLVVAFTDDPEPHRAELAGRRPTPTDDVGADPRPPIVDDRPIGEWDQTFDVVQATFTEAELLAAQEKVNELFDEPAVGLESTGMRPDINRVSLSLLEPTRERVAALATRVRTDRVCVNGEPLPPDRETFEPGDELDVIVIPGPDGTYPSDPVVTCGHHEFPLSALDTAAPVADSDDSHLLADLGAFLSGPEGQFWPQDGWYILTENDKQIELVSADPAGAAFLTFEATRVGWSLASASGAGKCWPRSVLPDGLGEVRWRLDPAFNRPTPDSTEIHVRVTEQACVGGQAMGDRLLGPQIIQTDSEVLIAFAAIQAPGAHTCPSNPSTALKVTLPAPLGERHVRDGLVVPIDISDRLN
jgi:hypothetical protein